MGEREYNDVYEDLDEEMILDLKENVITLINQLWK